MKDDHGNPSTYTNYGCRCELCVAAASKYHQRFRKEHRDSDRASSKANNLAAKWVRREHPEVWDELMDQAYKDIGARRNPLGHRP